jgi:histone acetyltransferase (RNA polymerase elongator complex component)
MTIVGMRPPNVNGDDEKRLLNYYVSVLVRYQRMARSSAEVPCLCSPSGCLDGSCLACEADRIVAEIQEEGGY